MKGRVLANCGAMGLDPAMLSISGYLEAMAASSADPKDAGADDASPELKRFMAAHGVAGNA